MRRYFFPGILGSSRCLIGAQPPGSCVIWSLALHSRKVSVLAARVSAIEPMGDEFCVYFTTGQEANQYIARISTAVKPKIEKDIDLVFDTTKAHYFDPKTEKRPLTSKSLPNIWHRRN